MNLFYDFTTGNFYRHFPEGKFKDEIHSASKDDIERYMETIVNLMQNRFAAGYTLFSPTDDQKDLTEGLAACERYLRVLQEQE